jgi:hypothetical protein
LTWSWPTTARGTLEEFCDPPSATEPLCTERIGWPQYLVASGKRTAMAFRPPFRYEVHGMKLGRHQRHDRARLRLLLLRGPSFEKAERQDHATLRPDRNHREWVRLPSVRSPLARRLFARAHDLPSGQIRRSARLHVAGLAWLNQAPPKPGIIEFTRLQIGVT